MVQGGELEAALALNVVHGGAELLVGCGLGPGGAGCCAWQNDRARARDVLADAAAGTSHVLLLGKVG